MIWKRSDPETANPLRGLDLFIEQLSAAGIPIGLGEILRLQHVFRMEPRLERGTLFDLLSCSLCKNPQQKRILADHFDAWCSETEGLLALSAQSESEPGEADKAGQGQPETGETPRHDAATAGDDQAAPDAQPAAKQPSAFKAALRAIRRSFGSLPIWLYLAIFWAAMGVMIWWVFIHDPAPGPPVTIEKLIDPKLKPPDETPPKQAEFAPVTEYWTWRPTVKAVPDPNHLQKIVGIVGLIVVTGLASLLTRSRFRRRFDAPKPETSRYPGPSWRPLLPQPAAAADLIPRAQLAGAVWSVDKFISEDRTPKLDLRRTIDHTCREGGIPVLHYQSAQYPREIWLWQDMDAGQATTEREIEELTGGFRRYGLPVRFGRFWGSPGAIEWEEGHEVAPLTLEGHRQQAWVFIFTDGAGIEQAASSALDRTVVLQLLGSLSQWPRLRFVDTANGHFGLARRLHNYGIACIQPQEVAEQLGGAVNRQARPFQPDPELTGDLSAWAAGVCLSADGSDYATATALLHALALDIEPWHYNTLAGDAGNERLIWAALRRAELLNWLSSCQPFTIGDKANRKTALGRALAFWRQRNHKEIEARRNREQFSADRWTDTPAHDRIRLELAFLDLWDRPEKAVDALCRLCNVFAAEIKQRLAQYAPHAPHDFYKGSNHKERIYLPWCIREIPDAALSRLFDLGFAKDCAARPTKLRRSGSYWFIQGLLWGMFAIGGVKVVDLVIAPPKVIPDDPVFTQPVFTSGVIESLAINLDRTADLIIGTAKDLQVKEADSIEDFRVRWSGGWTVQANPRPLGKNQVWYAGTLAQPIRACDPDWPRRSLVVIEADPEDAKARLLAAALLEKGSADKVLIGKDWRNDLQAFIQISAKYTGPDQLMIIIGEGAGKEKPIDSLRPTGWVSGDFGRLKGALSFAGVKTVQEVWGGLPGVEVEGPERLKVRGGPAEQPPGEDSPLHFVEVCGGTFSMGSESKAADDDEQPVHPVTLDTFWMARTEVTNAQYADFKNDWSVRDDKPVTGIDWNQAKAFCEHYDDHHLPTEAEWEYAARAGSLTAWSFGDHESNLADYAWYTKNSKGGAQAVKTRKPNPLGLYDMHGNVWEWVDDCYDSKAYPNRSKELPSLNPNNQTGSCTNRTLRGGSAWDEPRNLRSADRVSYRPENWFQYFGFRCVRGPAASLDP